MSTDEGRLTLLSYSTSRDAAVALAAFRTRQRACKMMDTQTYIAIMNESIDRGISSNELMNNCGVTWEEMIKCSAKQMKQIINRYNNLEKLI